jgi:hypothetical protein
MSRGSILARALRTGKATNRTSLDHERRPDVDRSNTLSYTAVR